MNQNETQIGNSWYVVISFEIITSKDLTDKEKLLLALISNLQNQKGYCYAGNQYIADLLNCSLARVSALVTNLVNLGWLKRRVYRNDKNEVTQRALMIVLKKKPIHFEDVTHKAPPPEIEHTPSPHKQADLPLNSGSIITKINKEEEEETKIFNSDLPTLEEIVKISAAAKNNQLWYERTCMALNLKRVELGQWMDLFDLHISNSTEIKNIDDRRYKVVFAGWYRSQNVQGKSLESYKQTQTQNSTNGKQYTSARSKQNDAAADFLQKGKAAFAAATAGR